MPINFPILEITDGTDYFSFVDCAFEWEPAIAQAKDGGVWRGSPMSDNRQLVVRYLDNVIETFTLPAISSLGEDRLITKIQDLRRLLEKAVAYWTTRWQHTPVYLRARGPRETNTRYALIHDYRTPADSNPYASSFWDNFAQGRSVFEDFDIIINRGHWLSEIPGESSCVEVSGLQEDWEVETWASNQATAGGDINDIIEATCGRMLAADTAQIWWTATGGAGGWVAVATGAGDETFAMAEATDGYVYAVGMDAGNLPNLYRSNDCGATWGLAPNQFGTDGHNSLIMASDGYMYCASGWSVIGVGAQVARSLPGGAWNQVLILQGAAPNDADAYCILEASDGYIYVSVRENVDQFRVYRSNDGFTTSQIVWQGTDAILILFEDDNQYLYGGTDGEILIGWLPGYTWDAGQRASWLFQTLTTQPTSLVYDITQRSTDGLIYACEDGVVWVAPSATETWVSQTLPAATQLYTLHEYSGNNRLYSGDAGNIFVSGGIVDMGRAATCEDEVYFVNQQSMMNLTHVKVHDFSAGAGGYTDELPMTATFDLLPAVPAVSDAVYFGIDTSLQTNGNPTFNNLVFDIDEPIAGAGGLTMQWQYSSGGAAWTAFPVTDNTNNSGLPFDTIGVNSVNWGTLNGATPWTAFAVDGITSHWIRCIITAIGGGVTQLPTQQNRDVYTVTWPHLDIDSAQVGGDLTALARIIATIWSDQDDAETAPNLPANRVLVGLRSKDRGPNFTAYLNISDEQNPPGITCTLPGGDVAFQTDIFSPTGRSVIYTKPAAINDFPVQINIVLDATVGRDFYGDYHAFARIITSGALADEVNMRLRIASPGGAPFWFSGPVQSQTTTRYELLDFGRLSLPISDLFLDSEIPSNMRFTIQIGSLTTNQPLTITFYDLILIPVDEWAGDFQDQRNSTTSIIEAGKYLDIDAIKNPKWPRRALVRSSASDAIGSVYRYVSPGLSILQSNADQRLWFLAGHITTAGGALWRWAPSICWSGRVEKVQRYLSARGDR